ncbi:MAG: DUF948 domain-containing protein [Actinomycetota bacterium]
MGPGGIATIIAASALVIIAIALGYAIVRVGNLIDEVQETVKNVNKIVSTAENFTEKVTGSITSLIEKNSGLLKILGSLAGAFAGKKFSRSDRENK